MPLNSLQHLTTPRNKRLSFRGKQIPFSGADLRAKLTMMALHDCTQPHQAPATIRHCPVPCWLGRGSWGPSSCLLSPAQGRESGGAGLHPADRQSLQLYRNAMRRFPRHPGEAARGLVQGYFGLSFYHTLLPVEFTQLKPCNLQPPLSEAATAWTGPFLSSPWPRGRCPTPTP